MKHENFTAKCQKYKESFSSKLSKEDKESSKDEPLAMRRSCSCIVASPDGLLLNYLANKATELVQHSAKRKLAKPGKQLKKVSSSISTALACVPDVHLLMFPADPVHQLCLQGHACQCQADQRLQHPLRCRSTSLA
jgi:hypothetical protein